MRVLWFSHFVPYPPTGGVFQRSFNLLREVSKRRAVQLVAFNSLGASKAVVDESSAALKKYCERVEVWEMPITWRRGVRWWVGLAASPFSSVPYNCRCYWSKDLDGRWREVLRGCRESVLHFDSLDLALYFYAAADLPKVLNHHNCESALLRRRGQNDRNPLKKAYLLNQARKLAALEREICPRFEVNVVCSEVDAQALRNHGAGIRTHLVENGVDTEYFRPIEGTEEPDTMIFSGMLNWEPNVEGIRYFVQEIWPLIRRDRPRVRLYLAGRDPLPSISHLQAQDRGIVVVPNPDDMRPWSGRAMVFICPILSGGGTRLKILDAMAMGKPIVSTSIGCEGLRVKNGEHLLVADDPENFAAAVCRLLEETPLRQRLARSGRALVESEYNWEAIGRCLDQAYQSALSTGRVGVLARG
ncbi:MAG: glycosyltransferase [Acidobacteriia bacterium]|nr:glycosyltransferase [Terriglobia bacterium]